MVGAVANGSLRVVDVAETRQTTNSREKCRVRRRQQISCAAACGHCHTEASNKIRQIVQSHRRAREAERHDGSLTPLLQPASDQGESYMDTVKSPDEGRRSFLAAAAAAGALSLLPTQMAAAAGDTTIRPFRVNVPEADLADLRKRIADKVARSRTGRRCNARRAVGDDAEARAVLGERARLAQVRGEDQYRAELHHRDRWTRHSFYSRSLEA